MKSLKQFIINEAAVKTVSVDIEAVKKALGKWFNIEKFEQGTSGPDQPQLFGVSIKSKKPIVYPGPDYHVGEIYHMEIYPDPKPGKVGREFMNNGDTEEGLDLGKLLKEIA